MIPKMTTVQAASALVMTSVDKARSDFLKNGNLTEAQFEWLAGTIERSLNVAIECERLALDEADRYDLAQIEIATLREEVATLKKAAE